MPAGEIELALITRERAPDIIERRKRMQADIDKLIKEKGEDAVVMK